MTVKQNNDSSKSNAATITITMDAMSTSKAVTTTYTNSDTNTDNMMNEDSDRINRIVRNTNNNQYCWTLFLYHDCVIDIKWIQIGCIM